MSVKLMSEIWACRLDRAEKWVLLAMADHASDDGKRCFPSTGYVAWKTGYSQRNVKRILSRLRTLGVLVPRGTVSGGRGYTVSYQIDLSVLERNPPYQQPKSDILSPFGRISQNGDTSRKTVTSRPSESLSEPPPQTSPNPVALSPAQLGGPEACSVPQVKTPRDETTNNDVGERDIVGDIVLKRAKTIFFSYTGVRLGVLYDRRLWNNLVHRYRPRIFLKVFKAWVEDLGEGRAEKLKSPIAVFLSQAVDLADELRDAGMLENN